MAQNIKFMQTHFNSLTVGPCGIGLTPHVAIWVSGKWPCEYYNIYCIARWSPLAVSLVENHFQGRGVRIQGHPLPCASLLEGTVCSRVKCSGIESKQICIPWDFIVTPATRNITYRQRSFCSSGTYLVELLPSENPQLQFDGNFSFQT